MRFTDWQLRLFSHTDSNSPDLLVFFLIVLIFWGRTFFWISQGHAFNQKVHCKIKPITFAEIQKMHFVYMNKKLNLEQHEWLVRTVCSLYWTTKTYRRKVNFIKLVKCLLCQKQSLNRKGHYLYGCNLSQVFQSMRWVNCMLKGPSL